MNEQNNNRRHGFRWIRRVALVGILVAAGLLCRQTTGRAADGAPQMAPQAVLVRVERAESGDISAAQEYIGTVEAMQSVKVKPEVSAKIARVHFKEGAFVKAGDVLFTLDSNSCEATVALRKAELSRATADRDRAQKYHKRLKSADARSVSAADLDTAYSDVQQSQAAVEQAKASLKLAQIDLNNTRITSPIDGRIGRALYTKGNYVSPAVEALAEIVQVSPVRVAFSLPDRSYFEELSAFRDSDGDVFRATLTLADGKQYDEQGRRDFENNVMDAASGTIAMSLRFENKKHTLIPGAIVLVGLTPTREENGILVSQSAIQVDSEGSYIYVIDKDNVAHKQRVTAGTEVGAKRAVTGIEAGVTVAIEGVQKLHDGATVQISEARVANAGAASTEAR